MKAERFIKFLFLPLIACSIFLKCQTFSSVDGHNTAFSSEIEISSESETSDFEIDQNINTDPNFSLEFAIFHLSPTQLSSFDKINTLESLAARAPPKKNS